MQFVWCCFAHEYNVTDARPAMNQRIIFKRSQNKILVGFDNSFIFALNNATTQWPAKKRNATGNQEFYICIYKS